MSFYDKIRNFFYAVTHSEQLVSENSNLRKQLFPLESEIRQLQDHGGFSRSGQEDDLCCYEQAPPEDAVPKIIPSEILPEGWNWVHYDDGSGSLHSPDGEHYFAYDRQPYYATGGIEFRETSSDHWAYFPGTMKNFKHYAETAVSENYLDKETPSLTAEAARPENRPSVKATLARIRMDNTPAAPSKERDICL